MRREIPPLKKGTRAGESEGEPASRATDANEVIPGRGDGSGSHGVRVYVNRGASDRGGESARPAGRGSRTERGGETRARACVSEGGRTRRESSLSVVLRGTPRERPRYALSRSARLNGSDAADAFRPLRGRPTRVSVPLARLAVEGRNPGRGRAPSRLALSRVYVRRPRARARARGRARPASGLLLREGRADRASPKNSPCQSRSRPWRER